MKYFFFENRYFMTPHINVKFNSIVYGKYMNSAIIVQNMFSLSLYNFNAARESKNVMIPDMTPNMFMKFNPQPFSLYKT